MAENALDEVRAPSLFIVGGDDTQVLGEAFERLDCEKHLYVFEGAGHSFEGEGKLETVADVAAEWFVGTLRTNADSDS